VVRCDLYRQRFGRRSNRLRAGGIFGHEVDYINQEEVWLQGIDEQAISDAVARLLIPLVEKKRKADDH
jgi:hypothetical protein